MFNENGLNSGGNSEDNADGRNRKNKFSDNYKGLLKNIEGNKNNQSDDEYDADLLSKQEKDKKLQQGPTFAAHRKEKKSPGDLSSSPGLRVAKEKIAFSYYFFSETKEKLFIIFLKKRAIQKIKKDTAILRSI